MPRSSGGGSHSGGSHSSSSSHSRSSGGGSHHGGSSYSSSRSYSSGSSGYSSHSYSSHNYSSRGYTDGSGSYAPYVSPLRVSKTSFVGSKKYVRRTNGVTEYLYATASPSTYTGGAGARFLTIILTMFKWLNLAMLVMLIGTFIYYSVGVGKINADYNKRIVIVDSAAVFSDTAELEKSLANFLEVTGVCPSVMTVNNEDWQSYYDALENYAYDLYVNSFDDEYHWLIVYSQPKNPDENFNDWYFEGMQGDKVGRVVTSTMAATMVDDLQRGFTKTSVSPEQAVADAFDNAADYWADISSPTFEGSTSILIAIIPFAVLAALPILLLRLLKKRVSKKYSGYVLDKGKNSGEEIPDAQTQIHVAAASRQRNCEYCGSLYHVGQDNFCPQCGAPISAE